MAKILSGKEVAAALNSRLQARAAALAEQGVLPTLAIVRVGEREDDLSYERGAMKRCSTVGVSVRPFVLPADVRQDELLAVIRQINEDPAVHGCLLFRPLPKHLDERAVCEALRPEKDVDCITSGSLAAVFSGQGAGYPPCTAQAVLEILDHFGCELRGKRVTVVGRSLVVGKPVSMMLLGRHATVTICHTRTADLPGQCRQAEILVAAAGKAGVIGKEHVSPGQVVVDVGINWDAAAGRLRGDVDFEQAEPLVEAITPVPGGGGVFPLGVVVGLVGAAAAGGGVCYSVFPHRGAPAQCAGAPLCGKKVVGIARERTCQTGIHRGSMGKRAGIQPADPREFSGTGCRR